MSTEPAEFLVYMGDEMVLEIRAEPGPLISRMAPPPAPGEGPVLHPFLSATAHVPEHEGTLREVLDRSDDLAEYLANLQALGFRVVAQQE